MTLPSPESTSTTASPSISRALVTGGAGFIGHHLVRTLLSRGIDVVVLDNLSVGRRDKVPAGVQLVEGDVRDADALRSAMKGVDAVFHLAAVVSVRASVDAFVRDADVNVLGTLRVIEAMHDHGNARVRKAVLASSMAVYADSLTPTPISESWPVEPVSPYGIAKLAAERYWHQLCPRAGVESTVLRLFNTWGPGQTPSPYVGVITHFAELLKQGKAPRIFGDGEQRRDFVHVDDVVQAFVSVLDHPVGGRTFNVGTGRATSVNEVAQKLIAAIAPHIEPEYEAPRPGELRNAIADISAARERLGYEPRRTELDFTEFASQKPA